MQKESTVKAIPLRIDENLALRTAHAIQKSQSLILSQQYRDGFWWYSLEANESIGAEFIMLLHYLGVAESYPQILKGLSQRILSQQREDGSWAIYHDGPGDLSTTLECYLALKLEKFDITSEPLKKAREFILSRGGLTQCRVFSRIHLALFGIVPWETCPAMPVSFVMLPHWFPLTIYEFSSWARACIVPLLVIMEKKRTVPLPNLSLDELFLEPPTERRFPFHTKKGLFSWENFFIQMDKVLKKSSNLLPSTPLTRWALKKAEHWIVEHIEKTEDIYPALAYGILALNALGRKFEDPAVQKCFNALLSFQQNGVGDLPPLPTPSHGHLFPPAKAFEVDRLRSLYIHQQCCISPVWDTPWALTSLLDSGLEKNHPALLKAGRWLISKQITHLHGDWAVKNKTGRPGGWSFEFENEYFPDVDDTIQVLSVLFQLDLPREEMAGPFQRGLDWLFSMQSKNGGWGAFDKDNTLSLVNKIPFSDHGACLDPPTPDITGRMLELLGHIGYTTDHGACQKALRFLKKNQEENGSWPGRWGVNYLYGTWCVLQGLIAIGISPRDPMIRKAAHWLKKVQNKDGGWSESCESYSKGRHVALPRSVASQTGWALMGLIAVGEEDSKEVRAGIEYLLSTQNSQGGWNESAYTGTGFPGHFYIRYHGYRHYFPLLALGIFQRALERRALPEPAFENKREQA